ncbi:aminopeptidase P family protein [candidate division WOR-3 bacterium]|nr:aminopeptidase P family protein [candidate division WOR-3 bacterium]
MSKRIERLQELLRREKLDGLVVVNLPNIRYLCGYTGSNGLMLVTRHDAWFYTDFRYKEQIRTEVKGCRKRVLTRDLVSHPPPEWLRLFNRLGVEQDHVTLSRFAQLRKRFRRALLVKASDLVRELRRTKEPVEVEMIAAAQRVTDRVFADVLKMVKPGVRERDLALEIEFQFRKCGEVAFDSIVASGPNSAKPHAGFSDRKLRKGDALTFDIGCRVRGYCSDMTRTVFVGKAPARLRRVYEVVHEAQRRALDTIKPGTPVKAADAAARDYITKQGFGKQFGHSLGHGVGIEVHELPALAATGKETLAPGDVVTVEPGVYLPGTGGVRIEDMVLVTKTGYRNFTRSGKTVLEL